MFSYYYLFSGIMYDIATTYRLFYDSLTSINSMLLDANCFVANHILFEFFLKYFRCVIRKRNYIKVKHINIS